MKNPLNILRTLAVALPVAVSVAGCSSGGVDGASTAAVTRVVTGQIAKGPVAGATVRLYAIDARGLASGPMLAEATTAATGAWAATVAVSNVPLLVVTTGGTYIDEADPEPDPQLRRSVTLGSAEGFTALLPADASSVAINAYTDALLRKSRYETQGDNFLAVHAANNSRLSNAFGFDLSRTLPADPIAPAGSATLAQRQYALALGGIANVINAYAVANQQAIADYPIINAVIDDLTDCSVDGQSVAGPVSGVTTVSADLNLEVLRFRNNNFAAYQATPLLEIDLAQCAASGQQPDTIAPVFTTVPVDFTVAAVDANGTPSTAAAVATGLALAAAVDDRDGALNVSFNLPAVLALGNHTVTLSAADQAGNQIQATVVITVADLDAPTIVAPADLDVAATGALTQVELGTPQVSDNVTAALQLTVSNDAPANGFVPGLHSVVWVVTDAAGLSSEATQSIVVRNTAPVIVTPQPDLQATEGQPFTTSLINGISDPDSNLSFTLAGLPAGSGLTFTSATGVLSGLPNDTDALASPMTLTLTASDETQSVSDVFELTVIDVNNAPVFSVVAQLQLQEDFAGPVTLDVVPATVRPGDPNDVVYTVNADAVDFAALSIDSVTGQVSVTALPNANGQGTFDITANDGAVENNLHSETVTIVVAAVNDPPVFTLSGDIEVVPGYTGSAQVSVIPADVPDDELTQTVTYSVEHSVTYATVTIDSGSGLVTISNVSNVDAVALIAVTADDGAATHTALFNFIVRDSDKFVFVGEPVDNDDTPLRPVFPGPGEFPAGYSATGLPDSLTIDFTTGLLSGIPTVRVARIGVFPATVQVFGSAGTEAHIPLLIRVNERDSDDDGLADRLELIYATDAHNADTDNDGIGDGIEVEAGTDPALSDARVIRLSPEQTNIDPQSFADSSELSPVYVTLAPGNYAVDLQFAAPCDSVILVGGIDEQTFYPDIDKPAVLSGNSAPALSLSGCKDMQLHHLHLAHGQAGALTSRQSLFSMINVSAYLNSHDDAAAFELKRSKLYVRDSVYSGNAGTASALRVGPASTLRIVDSVLQHDDATPFFNVLPHSHVNLIDVITDGVALDKKQYSVTQTGADTTHRHTPDLVELRRAGTDYIATLRYRDFRLEAGYRVELHGNEQRLRAYDLNYGTYLIRPVGSIDAGDIMLFVDGVAVDFVVLDSIAKH